MNQILFNILSIGILMTKMSPSFAATPASAAIYDGSKWHALETPRIDAITPMKPVSLSWNDPTAEVFIAISQFRDSKRCSETLREIFQKADKPGKYESR